MIKLHEWFESLQVPPSSLESKQSRPSSLEELQSLVLQKTQIFVQSYFYPPYSSSPPPRRYVHSSHIQLLPVQEVGHKTLPFAYHSNHDSISIILNTRFVFVLDYDNLLHLINTFYSIVDLNSIFSPTTIRKLDSETLLAQLTSSSSLSRRYYTSVQSPTSTLTVYDGDFDVKPSELFSKPLVHMTIGASSCNLRAFRFLSKVYYSNIGPSMNRFRKTLQLRLPLPITEKEAVEQSSKIFHQFTIPLAPSAISKLSTWPKVGTFRVQQATRTKNTMSEDISVPSTEFAYNPILMKGVVVPGHFISHLYPGLSGLRDRLFLDGIRHVKTVQSSPKVTVDLCLHRYFLSIAVELLNVVWKAMLRSPDYFLLGK